MKIDIEEFKKAPKSQLRSFGLMMSAVLGLGFAILLPLALGKPIHLTLIYISLVFLFLGLVFPKVLIILYVPWMIIGGVLGAINSKIILGLIYYLIFTSVALIMRLINIDPMKRQIDKTKKSYRKTVSETNNNMENPF